MNTKSINVFFAVDDNYIDYLAVAMKSIIDNAKDLKYSYNFIVITLLRYFTGS